MNGILFSCFSFSLQIVHMKRFQFVNGRWVKSQKIVKFPKHNFDPSNFLAPRETCNRASPAGIQMPLRRDTETQTSEPDSLGPRSGISVSTIKVVDSSKTEQDSSAPTSTSSTQKCNEGNGAGSSGEVEEMDIDDQSESKLEAKSDIADTTTTRKEEVSQTDDKNQRTEGQEDDRVSRPSGLPEPLTINTDVDEEDYSNSVDATGEGGHPPLERSKSQLSPPVDATDAHPLLSQGEEEDQRPLYNLYAVVVSHFHVESLMMTMHVH